MNTAVNHAKSRTYVQVRFTSSADVIIHMSIYHHRSTLFEKSNAYKKLYKTEASKLIYDKFWFTDQINLIDKR